MKFLFVAICFSLFSQYSWSGEPPTHEEMQARLEARIGNLCARGLLPIIYDADWANGRVVNYLEGGRVEDAYLALQESLKHDLGIAPGNGNNRLFWAGALNMTMVFNAAVLSCYLGHQRMLGVYVGTIVRHGISQTYQKMRRWGFRVYKIAA